jgi:hypothetical protein
MGLKLEGRFRYLPIGFIVKPIRFYHAFTGYRDIPGENGISPSDIRRWDKFPYLSGCKTVSYLQDIIRSQGFSKSI